MKQRLKIEDVEYLALMDSGSHLSTIAISLDKKLWLKLWELDQTLRIEVTQGADIPYLWSVKASLKI